MKSNFRINPLRRNLLHSGIAFRAPRAAIFGPAESATINRKWCAGNTAWVEIISNSPIVFSAKFSVLWITEYKGRPYVLIQQEPVEDDVHEPKQFILRIINGNTLLTVDARQLELLVQSFEESFENRAPWQAADSAKYFGELPPFGSAQYKADKLIRRERTD